MQKRDVDCPAATFCTGGCVSIIYCIIVQNNLVPVKAYAKGFSFPFSFSPMLVTAILLSNVNNP